MAEASLPPGVGRVERVDGEWSVCEAGLALRLGLQDGPPDPAEAAALYPLFQLLPDEEAPEPGEAVGAWPVFAWIPQSAVAELMQLTPRQVQNLHRKGLPNRGRGRTRRYPLPHVVLWFRAYRAMGEPEALRWDLVEAHHRLQAARRALAEAR